MNRNDIVCVKEDGTVAGVHKPSSELPFHAAVYKMRPDLKAVLHAHPSALVSFSIARTDMKIQELAEKCGYADALYFAQVFKKNVGATPSEYRRANRF